MFPGGMQARSCTRQYRIIRVYLGALAHRGHTWERDGGQIGGVGSGTWTGFCHMTQCSQNLSAMYLWFPGVYPDSPQSSPASHAPVTGPAPIGFPACAIAAQSRLPTRFVEECTALVSGKLRW